MFRINRALLLLIFFIALQVWPVQDKADNLTINEPINIIINDWTSQIVLAHITGEIFERTGHTINYSFSTTDQQWGALSQGLLHIQVEVWQGTMEKMFNRMVSLGRIVDAGNHSAITREEWLGSKRRELHSRMRNRRSTRRSGRSSFRSIF